MECCRGPGRSVDLTMYHVLTAHHAGTEWVDAQTNALRACMPPDTQIVASLPPSDEARFAAAFDRVVPSLGVFAGNLSLVSQVVAQAAAPDDVLVFVDSDSFPVRPMSSFIDGYLDRAPLAAIRRDEVGDCQPHPSFAVTTVGFWRKLNGNWSTGHPWTNTLTGRPHTAVGGNLLRALELRNERWEPITRTASFGEHPIWFGIYGDCVYHHGVHGCQLRKSRPDLDVVAPKGALARVERLLPGKLGHRLLERQLYRERQGLIAEEREESRRLMAQFAADGGPLVAVARVASSNAEHGSH